MKPIELAPRERDAIETLHLVGGDASPRDATRRLESDLDEIVEQAAEVALADHIGDMDGLRLAATRLGMRASALGLKRIARVGRDVNELAMGSDWVARAAAVARLHRLSVRAVEDIWELDTGAG